MPGCATNDELRLLTESTQNSLQQLILSVNSMNSCHTVGASAPGVAVGPKYFAYYYGPTDPNAGANNLWCGRTLQQPVPPGQEQEPVGCTTVFAKHKTVFLMIGNGALYAEALGWVSSSSAIENVFIFVNFAFNMSSFKPVLEWQKKHKKIKAIYIADEPILNKTTPGIPGFDLLVNGLNLVKQSGAFQDTKLFCTFSEFGLGSQRGPADFLTTLNQAGHQVDWIGYDYYYAPAVCANNPFFDIKGEWTRYLKFADLLLQIQQTVAWNPKLFVIPQLSGYDVQNDKDSFVFGKRMSNPDCDMISVIWNKLIINWGIRHDVVAIIPFISILAMYQSPTSFDWSTSHNHGFLEKTRKQIESGHEWQRCGPACLDQGVSADPNYMYPVQDSQCVHGACTEFYPSSGGDYCCAETYDKNNEWVISPSPLDEHLCCSL